MRRYQIETTVTDLETGESEGCVVVVRNDASDRELVSDCIGDCIDRLESNRPTEEE